MGSFRPPANLHRFFRRLLWTIPVAALFWWLALLFYSPALCWFTQGVARLTESPPAAQIIPEGNRALLGRLDMKAGSARLRLSLIQIHSNLVPFLALVLALPGRRTRTWWASLGTGVLLLFISHSLTLLWQLKAFYAFSLGPWSAANYTDAHRALFGALRYFFDLPVTYTLPLLLWITLFSEQVVALVGIAQVDQGAQSAPRR